jgi:hypothetical protein
MLRKYIEGHLSGEWQNLKAGTLAV